MYNIQWLPQLKKTALLHVGRTSKLRLSTFCNVITCYFATVIIRVQTVDIHTLGKREHKGFTRPPYVQQYY